MGIGSKPCLDIRPSIDQINDRSISFSQLGKGTFEFGEMLWSESNLFSLSRIAPKFRNSFVGTMPDLQSSARRPNSIISLSSSTSSGGSSVSSSCIKLSNSRLHHHRHHMSDESERAASHCHLRSSSSSSDVQKDKKSQKQGKIVPCKFKYSRSTTVVSQCSTGN